MSKQENIPRMNHQQYRRMQGLVQLCCNYDHGDCLALDNGWDSCVCAQRITYSLSCKWFRACVLPQDPQLEAELLHRADQKSALYAAARSYLNPTGQNTVLTVLQKFNAAKRPKVSDGAGLSAWNVKRAKSLANQGFRPRCQRGADTFIVQAVK